MMGSKEPSYPLGVLDATVKTGENRVTWQPHPGFRYATVAVKYSGGYVVAARSLHETESLIDIIGRLVALAWLACLVCLAIALLVIHIFAKKVLKTKCE
jgi:hypothetical protein